MAEGKTSKMKSMSFYKRQKQFIEIVEELMWSRHSGGLSDNEIMERMVEAYRVHIMQIK